MVTAVWAVAASAIGIIALVAANEDDEATARAVSKELNRVQRDVNTRLDTLEQDINDLARREDVTRLEQRVGRAEDRASAAAKDANAATDTTDDLRTRIEELEADVDANADGGNNNQDEN
jgi:hypothetical protein